MQMQLKYSLDDINQIIFNGFDIKLEEETLKIISELFLQVGSPDYVKTPVFQKRNNMSMSSSVKSGSGSGLGSGSGHSEYKKNKKSKSDMSDNNWEVIRNFQATKIEEKVGFDVHIDGVRVLLNKLTDKNYIDIRNKILEQMDALVLENTAEENMERISTDIFTIASTNRFYSKIFADLYSDLVIKYDVMKQTVDTNFKDFTSLFTTFEYVDPNVDYDRFCEINKINEKRRSLAAFYLNLAYNNIISKTTIVHITRNLLEQVYTFINEVNKKNEVDELTETVCILYKKDLYSGDEDELIDGLTIPGLIQKIAKSKVNDYKSLTNKSLFKFMDMVEM